MTWYFGMAPDVQVYFLLPRKRAGAVSITPAQMFATA
jgi:hypothetical protein